MGEIAINQTHNVHKKYRDMNFVNPYIFAPPVDLSTNTEIGGVSATISTPALLATKLGILESRITNFSIVGSDIQCKITGSYTSVNFNGDTSITYFDDKDGLITDLMNFAFGNAPNLKRLSLKGIINLSGAYIVRYDQFTSRTIEVYLDNCVTMGSSAFYDGLYSNLFIYAPRCTTLGASTSVDNQNFYRVKTGSIIYINSFTQTSNAGGVEADVAHAISQGATVRYVTNFTAPNPVTTLAAGTIYNTAIQLNFTPPSSTNAIDYYECWANGVQKNNITASGKYITGLTPNTSYNITLIAVDIFYNKSVVSNSLSVTTANASLDADASAYMVASVNGQWQPEINTLFTSLKSNSLYTKLQAFYLFLGTTAAQHKWNGKNPLDTDGAFRLVFSGAATFSNNGYQLNGSSFANTYFTPSGNQSLNNNGFTIVVGTNNAAYSSDVWDIGAYSSGSSTSLMRVKKNNSTYDREFALNVYPSYIQTGVNESRGVFTAVKQSSTVSKFLRNGTLLGSGTGGGTLSTANFFIGALSVSNSPASYSNQRFQGVYFHEGLSDAEVATLYTIIDTFETALGRKTW
jgi:hypothetical protein